MNRMKNITAALGVAFSIALCCSSVEAQTPAETSAPASIGQFMSNLNPMNWKMPSFKSMLPGQEDKTRIIKKKDGLVSDVKDTASKSWQKTKEIFDPSRLSPANLFVAKEPATTETKTPGFFGSLFAPQEEAEQIATATDFLALPKIER
ncbi:hypothetical protein Q31b_01580 [Novipirellula aureliae]|uniref:Uncharacterized protein n=1 Tax=Novipirellula aureliae TaxID=2527966 RepID=A0A5C6EAI6_9BACT|nr:hypothetical protein [Novipirellula aureliae]TWU44987.1 hypothetical protein Q31b_01580 [Novipirellula aureliae]